MPLHTYHRIQPPIGRALSAYPDRPLGLLPKCPVHGSTPLSRIERLARELGVAEILVENETAPMGLGSFKALGRAFAVAQMICEESGVSDPMLARDCGVPSCAAMPICS